MTIAEIKLVGGEPYMDCMEYESVLLYKENGQLDKDLDIFQRELTELVERVRLTIIKDRYELTAINTTQLEKEIDLYKAQLDKIERAIEVYPFQNEVREGLLADKTRLDKLISDRVHLLNRTSSVSHVAWKLMLPGWEGGVMPNSLLHHLINYFPTPYGKSEIDTILKKLPSISLSDLMDIEAIGGEELAIQVKDHLINSKGWQELKTVRLN